MGAEGSKLADAASPALSDAADEGIVPGVVQLAADALQHRGGTCTAGVLVKSSGAARTSAPAVGSLLGVGGRPATAQASSRNRQAGAGMPPVLRSESASGAPPAAHQPHISAAKQRQMEQAANSKAWLHNNQTRAGGAADVRRAATATRGTRAASARTGPSLAEQLGQLLSNDDAPQASFEKQMEERRAEVVSKLATFIKPSMAAKGGGAKVPVPQALPQAPRPARRPSAVQAANWEHQISASRAVALSQRRGSDSGVAAPAYSPLTQDSVAGEIEKSLGPTYNTFSTYQGTITAAVESGLEDTFLEQFFDEDSERQLTTYDKWTVIRQAAEQVLQVYTNRSNARVAEEELWCAPSVLDVRTGAASSYASAVETALNQGMVALALIDDGRLVESGGSAANLCPLLAADLWQVMKKLAPHKVPSGQRLEKLSVLGRHLLGAVVALETRYGAHAVKGFKVVLAFDAEQEHFMVSELARWSFYGLQPQHVALLPLPRFHGFAQDVKRGTLAHVKGSPQLLLGSGYAMYLMASPAEAYTLDASGTTPTCLPGTVLDWLRDAKANWLTSRLVSDLNSLRPDAALDTDFLTGAVCCADRQGASMVMEVMRSTTERDARAHNSVVLGRQSGGVCTLPMSAMRTVQSWKLMQAQVAAPDGFHVCTQRFAFKVAALQRLLSNPTNFRADVTLHGFYAYASVELGALTTLKDGSCACVLAHNMAGPDMSQPVLTRNWLIQNAGALEEQDKVDAFRHKAIDLIKVEALGGTSGSKRISGRMSGALGARASQPLESMPSRTGSDLVLRSVPSFKERKSGFLVALVLSPEHKALASTALKMARPFIRNIVDRLHVVLVMSGADAQRGGSSSASSQEVIKQLMAELVDKELEFNGQVTREIVTRSDPSGGTLIESLKQLLLDHAANIVVVPSLKLCGPCDLGQLNGSLALSIAKGVTSCPVLVVKANTCGRFAPPSAAVRESGGARDHLVAMAHLDSTVVAPMVEAITERLLTPGRDVLYLAKCQAYERPGLMSMRTRRLFVQARMALACPVRLEERAFEGHAVPELTKAVEQVGVDVLAVSVSGELQISREVEELLRGAKTCLLIHRNRETPHSGATAGTPAFVVEEPAPTVGYAYGAAPATATGVSTDTTGH